MSLAFLNPRCPFCEHSEANFMDRPRVAFVSSFKGSWLDLRAMALEDIVFVLCEGAEGAAVPVCGWVVALPGADAVIATSDQSASSLPQTITETAGGQKVCFLRVPQDSLTVRAPLSWTGPRPRDLPSLKQCLEGWKKAE